MAVAAGTQAHAAADASLSPDASLHRKRIFSLGQEKKRDPAGKANVAGGVGRMAISAGCKNLLQTYHEYKPGRAERPACFSKEERET